MDKANVVLLLREKSSHSQIFLFHYCFFLDIESQLLRNAKAVQKNHKRERPLYKEWINNKVLPVQNRALYSISTIKPKWKEK